MSTGANCYFTFEKGKGYSYAIQRYPYGATEDYDRHGPFKHFGDALRDLDRSYANPGGWSGPEKDPDCLHDVPAPAAESWRQRNVCYGCGAWLDRVRA